MDRKEHEVGEEIRRRITCFTCGGDGRSYDDTYSDGGPCSCAGGLDREGLLTLLREQEMRIRALEKACAAMAVHTWRA